MRGKKIILTCLLLVMAFGLIGCDAFVRKFTRKPKKKDLTPEEMVLLPQEYGNIQISKEERYRQNFLFWKSWQDELINSLTPDANHKKQIDCVQEAVRNLQQLALLLNEEKQKELNIYISQMTDLEAAIVKDLYGNNVARNRSSAERIKMNILRGFSFNKIKSL